MTRDLIGFLVIAGLSAWGGWELCATYGKAAREYAKIVREMQTKNRELQEFAARDARDAIAEEDRAMAEDAEFAKAVSTLEKCLLSQTQADALNKIGGE